MECSYDAALTEQHRDATGASGIFRSGIVALNHLAGCGTAQADGLASISGVQRHVCVCYHEL
jgi:hypothetical protein